jgi:hypothetical protein
MTDTELTTHRIMDAWMRRNDDMDDSTLDGFHACATHGCPNLILGSRYCARCEEEHSGEPFTLAGILADMPRYVRYLFWTTIILGGAGIATLIVLL